MAARYQPRAEPTIDSYAEGRAAYVPRGWLASLAAEGPTAWRRVWRLGGTVVSVERADGIIVRSRDEWGTREDLERAIRWWMARDYRAASPGGLLLQAARDWYRPVAWTRYGWAWKALAGGWEEAQVRGAILGPHKVLDMRRAYRWALTAEPFPDRCTMRVARRWCPTLPGLHLVDVDPWPGAPWPMRDGGRVLVETPCDVDRYGMPTVREWVEGVTWHHTIDTAGLAGVLDDINVPALYRCYWGLWVANTPTVCSFRSGKETRLRPYGADAVRAHLILQRVRRRMGEMTGAVHRYVDAVMVPAGQAVATGDNAGDWRVVREYPDGVRIRWPGHYGPLVGPPDKHAGIPTEKMA